MCDVVVVLVFGALVAGCGNGGGDRSAGRAERLVAAACKSRIPAQRLAGVPGYPAEGRAGLVAAGTVQRPGTVVRMTVVNRSRRPVAYDSSYRTESRLPR